MKNSMKKIFTFALTLAFLAIGLTGCFGIGSDDTTDSASTADSDAPYFYTYITAEFEIDAPDTWEKVTAFTSEYPDEIRVAFRNNIKDSDLTANVTVLREENEKTITNADYAQSKLADHAETVLNYQLLSQEEVTLYVGGGSSKTVLNTFQGKTDATSPTLNFKQIYLVKGDKSWAVTATYRTDEDPFVVERLDEMLKSFLLK